MEITECYKNLSVLSVSPHRYNLVPVNQDFLSWEALGSRWKGSLEIEVRRELLKQEDRRSVMSREQSDDEDSTRETRTNKFVDTTAETEVGLWPASGG